MPRGTIYTAKAHLRFYAELKALLEITVKRSMR
jgi:hypothetical protein